MSDKVVKIVRTCSKDVTTKKEPSSRSTHARATSIEVGREPRRDAQ